MAQAVNEVLWSCAQSRNNPVQRSASGGDTQRHALQRRMSAVDEAVSTVNRTGENKSLLGARQGDVENTQLFLARAALDFGGDELVHCGGIFKHASSVDGAKADFGFSLKDHATITVAQVEFRAQAQKEDHGKFHSFSAVDAHDADDVVGCSTGRGDRDGLVVFVEGFNKA